MIDLPLKPVSPEWQSQQDCIVTREPWLVRKMDRTRRTSEHFAYLYRNVPELLNTEKPSVTVGGLGRSLKPGLVIDIGPGAGELLEIMRHFDYPTLGIDAANGRGGMGEEYLDYCRLMTKRQGLNVLYVGFEKWVFGEQHAEINGTAAFINSRGSIEQALSRYMVGDPHHLHHDARLLRWGMTARLREVMEAMFVAFVRLLRPGGVLLIHANGAENSEEYDRLVTDVACKAGLKLERHEPPTLHKWRKP